MMRTPLSLLLFLLPAALADVEFTTPKAGASITVSASVVSIDVEWEDSGAAPAADDKYDLKLCAGGTAAGSWDCTTTLGSALSLSTPQTQYTFPATAGGDIKNAYFLQITATGTGGTVINYSDRFTLDGMTGAFPANIEKGAKANTGTAGPPSENQANVPMVEPGSEQYDVPFGEQTGPIRYAPMMKVPPKKVTKKDKSPLYPASSYQTATTFLPPATIQTTMTQSQTFSVSSRENDATPAPMPHDDMARFLARWKD